MDFKEKYYFCHSALDAESISTTLNKDRFPFPDQVEDRFRGNDIGKAKIKLPAS
jgi:hypothetical protein